MNSRRPQQSRQSHDRARQGHPRRRRITGTIKKRFDAINTECTEDNRRDYREMMFRSAEGMKHISGVILYDETIWQKAKDGTLLVDIIKKAGSLPGIKVDEGTKPLPGCPNELITIGPRQARRPADEILRAGRALRQMARRDRHRLRHSDRRPRSTPTPMRSRATLRSAKWRRSCRSSSRKC